MAGGGVGYWGDTYWADSSGSSGYWSTTYWAESAGSGSSTSLHFFSKVFFTNPFRDELNEQFGEWEGNFY